MKFDPDRSDIQGERDAKKAVENEFGAGYKKAATNRGSLKARTNTGGQPVNVSDVQIVDSDGCVVYICPNSGPLPSAQIEAIRARWNEVAGADWAGQG